MAGFICDVFFGSLKKNANSNNTTPAIAAGTIQIIFQSSCQKFYMIRYLARDPKTNQHPHSVGGQCNHSLGGRTNLFTRPVISVYLAGDKKEIITNSMQDNATI